MPEMAVGIRGLSLRCLQCAVAALRAAVRVIRVSRSGADCAIPGGSDVSGSQVPQQRVMPPPSESLEVKFCETFIVSSHVGFADKLQCQRQFNDWQ